MITSIISPLVIFVAVGVYAAHQNKMSKINLKKITKAKEYGTHEPVHIHPLVDPGVCIGSGACASACPERDILGLVNGRASLINSSHCIGHGACASACPVGAIKLVFGTETRGVDIPYVTPNFETNVKGIFIVGELGGMGLIKNAVTQGREVIEYMLCMLRSAEKKRGDALDLLIVGAGPAGISASLAAVKNKLKFVTIEQEDIGGTVLQYPRQKIVMTSPMELPMYGKVKLGETSVVYAMTGCSKEYNSTDNPNPAELTPTGTIQGYLNDAVTQQPIVGAVIDIGVGKATTSETGQFTIRDVPATSSSGDGIPVVTGSYMATIDLRKVTSPVTMTSATATPRYPDFAYNSFTVTYTSLNDTTNDSRIEPGG